MIDIHSHFLYGLDDGATDIKMSLAMLKQAEHIGISTLLATPHANEHTTSQLDSHIQYRFDEIGRLISDHSIKIEIQLAAEISYNSELLSWLNRPWALVGTQQRYILFELPLQGIPKDISNTIFQLGLKKVTPIMAHPERNFDILSEPGQLLQWIHQGTLLQMNAGSITGQFGKKCQRFSERLLKARAVHIVASDAHDSNNRNYAVFQRAFERIRNLYGSDYANLLFEKNPRNILDGAEVSRLQIREEKIRNIFLHKIFGK